ncbi:MAG: alpha/beta hydrolase, partial [Candidatus Contendobacter sp.]|nr:alpha/beta hydrolase [Candidatus Contendobacter sp.]
MNAQTAPRQTTPCSGVPLDPFDIVESTLAMQQAWLRQPERLAASLQGLALDAARVRDRFIQTSLGLPGEPAVEAVIHDERFQDPFWSAQPSFSYLKELYLVYGRWLEDAIYATEDVDPKQRQRAAFWTRQWLDAIAPSNFFWTNPEALRRAITSQGYSVFAGLQHWLRDAATGDVRMV